MYRWGYASFDRHNFCSKCKFIGCSTFNASPLYKKSIGAYIMKHLGGLKPHYQKLPPIWHLCCWHINFYLHAWLYSHKIQNINKPLVWQHISPTHELSSLEIFWFLPFILFCSSSSLMFISCSCWLSSSTLAQTIMWV